MDLNENTGLPYQPDDMNMRLADSLVMHGGRPFYVKEYMYGDNALYGYYTDKDRNEDKLIKLPNRYLDIRPPRLGYMNTRRNSYYVSRVPVRRYKQGLNRQNIAVGALNIEPGLNRGDTIRCVELARCILNKYPSLDECLEKLQDGRNACAFHRHWAITAGGELHYRGNPVGAYQKGNLKLTEDYCYLQEAAEEALDECA